MIKLTKKNTGGFAIDKKNPNFYIILLSTEKKIKKNPQLKDELRIT